MAGHAFRWTVRVEGIAKNIKSSCVGHVNTTGGFLRLLRTQFY